MRLVLGDDSVLFREGLARMLTEAGHEIVGQAGTADELLALVAENVPDVAVIDIRMPPTRTAEGLIAALQIRREHPSVGILVLSQYVETHHAVKLLGDRAEGVGYLLKERVTDPDDLDDAVRRVGSGGSAIDPHIIATLMRRRRRLNPLERLSDREREVLELMAEGRSNSAIAERLFLTSRTVETHIRNIFSKLELEDEPADHRRVLAVVALLRSGDESTTDA